MSVFYLSSSLSMNLRWKKYITFYTGALCDIFFQALKMCELEQWAMQWKYDITVIGWQGNKKEFCCIQFVVNESCWVFYLLLFCRNKLIQAGRTLKSHHFFKPFFVAGIEFQAMAKKKFLESPKIMKKLFLYFVTVL